MKSVRNRSISYSPLPTTGSGRQFASGPVFVILRTCPVITQYSRTWSSTEIKLFEKLIGIDLGTVNVIVYVSGKGIILQEPSVVAISARDNKIVAVGQEARDMLGRTPESIEVARPLRAGVGG